MGSLVNSTKHSRKKRHQFSTISSRKTEPECIPSNSLNKENYKLITFKNIDVKICFEIKSNNAEKESYNITKWDLF